MNQSKHVKNISKFNMGDCKSRSTSCKININKIIENKVKLIDNGLYPEIISNLIYIMIAMRPDICNTVPRLSQDLVKPTTIHLTRVKHILYYLKGIIN